jgi:hypothetical protein
MYETGGYAQIVFEVGFWASGDGSFGGFGGC